MPTTHIDLTIELRSADGSHTEFYQSDEDSIGKVLNLLNTPRLFSQPLLTLASGRSVSIIPTRTIDLIQVRTSARSPLLLPPGWLDMVEVGSEAFHIQRVLDVARNPESDGLPAQVAEGTSFMEIHTIGDWVVILKLRSAMLATLPDQRQRFAHFFEVPVLPFRLETGGVGFINPANISRVTVYPAFEGITETGLPADLLRCIRA
jgi:hypothetical protein